MNPAKKIATADYSGHILVVDDDDSLGEAIASVLESRGFSVTTTDDGKTALELTGTTSFDAVVTDFRMPGMGGMPLLKSLRASQPQLPVIMMTAFSTSERAIEATRTGAFDYLIKPFQMPDLLEVVRKAVATRRLTSKPVNLGQSSPGQDTIIGSSRAMQNMFKDIGRVASKPVSVLIKGETGSGKELVARAIFQNSGRGERPFVAVNCAAIPENLIESELFGHERGAFTGAHARRTGRFEQSDGGTLFLDEIGDLPPQTQVKLLRVLQERVITRVGGREQIAIDVRIIAATHRNLDAMVRDGSFREDLFYRINTAVITIPPLRERTGDIPALVSYFLANHAGEFGIPNPSIHKDALSVLTSHPWPGNVRQLQNVVRRALIEANGFAISPEMIGDSLDDTMSGRPEHEDPSETTTGSADDGFASFIRDRIRAASLGELEAGAYETLLADLEQELYGQAILLSHGNQSTVAKWLGVSRLTVREKLDRYGLFPKRAPAAPASS